MLKGCRIESVGKSFEGRDDGTLPEKASKSDQTNNEPFFCFCESTGHEVATRCGSLRGM